MIGFEAFRRYGRMVKFSHSVFALPFALAGAVLAFRTNGIEERKIFWVIVAMVGARNAGMGFNRLVDARFDAANPRTRSREIPTGLVAPRHAWALTLALAALFVLASFQLNRLCGLLSPIALALVFGYSYTKRFTWMSHMVLGLVLALAPVGAWLAIEGRFAAVPLWLGLAVLLWVAGFDLVYACQDEEFDRSAGLRSIPVRFGAGGALALALALHALALVALALVGVVAKLHPVYWIGWATIGLLMARQQALVRPGELSRVDVAFFNVNAWIAVIFLVTILVAVAFEQIVADPAIVVQSQLEARPITTPTVRLGA